ncbi:hypothetical protein L1887_16044 [Cichorium endivia]|nr:hypothetical protein L1887_16044 [Cichorium endivia]
MLGLSVICINFLGSKKMNDTIPPRTKLLAVSDMERTSAACAMDWSIHLDKALRSSNPGRRTEAIREVGTRLERWGKEPELSMAEHDMFDLVPGEDKLFANAILLRLADTFMSGDKQIKLCIVKIFLSELKHRKTKGFNRKNKGILSKNKVENHLELLRRVKVCFNSGDEDVRAMSLLLFGCWSDFAKDNADIRYLILSSIVSCHVLEVKASLFAAGCFCELSDNFARVLLEMLVNMVSSPEIPITSRLAGVRSFAKLGRSSTLSIKAFEEGLKLILCSMEDDIVTTMLISLSIIASKSAILISRQVDILLSYLSQDKSMPLQATSLRCLHILLSRTRFRFSPSIDLITAMFTMLNGQLPPIMQFDALHILHEILLSKMLTFSCLEMKECFTKLLTVVESLMKSPLLSIRLFSMRVLLDISGKFTRRHMSYEDGSKNLASQAISFLMARITSLANMEIDQEIFSLLKIIIHLLNESPNLDEFVLNEVHLFIKKNGVLTTGKGQTLSKLVVCTSKVVNVCLKNLVKSGPLSSQIQNVVKLLIEEVCGSSYLDYHVHIIYYLLLHPYTSYNLDESSYLIKNEILALEKAKELIKKDNWSAYKIGKYAACQGAWFVSAFIFGELLTMVSSDSYRHWLTSLTLYSYSEIKIQYSNSPKELSLLLNWLHSNRSDSPIIRDLNETEIENLDSVSKILQSSKEILSANGVSPGHQHYFQIQFLSLRSNVMETVGHIFKLLPLEQLSNRLLKLAREYDLFAMSFADMDHTSRMLISSHALSCSVLAFITGFSQSDFHGMLIEDLMGRIWNIDRETCKELMLLLETSKTHCVPQSKTLENTYEVRSMIKICVNAAKGMCNNNKEIKLVLDAIKKWLNISLRTPKYLFNVRPHVSCELFAMNRDSGNGGRISVMPGCHLHLDLCLQLSDTSSQFRAKLTKLYCILHCSGQSKKDKGQTDVELNEKIVKYVNNGGKIRSNDEDCSFDGKIAESILCFRVNGEGQGFGSCMLDVSRFGFGCYEIKWRAGFVDVDGSYWSLNSLNSGPVFTVQKSC